VASSPAEPGRKQEVKVLPSSRTAKIDWDKAALVLWQAALPAADDIIAKQLANRRQHWSQRPFLAANDGHQRSCLPRPALGRVEECPQTGAPRPSAGGVPRMICWPTHAAAPPYRWVNWRSCGTAKSKATAPRSLVFPQATRCSLERPWSKRMPGSAARCRIQSKQPRP